MVAKAIEDTVFTDFKYKKIFQVSIKYLEQQTGLNFSWKGVKQIQVPNDKNQIEKIRKIKDVRDAEKAEKILRAGFVPTKLEAKAHVTDAEIKKKNFMLNIILP